MKNFDTNTGCDCIKIVLYQHGQCKIHQVDSKLFISSVKEQAVSFILKSSKKLVCANYDRKHDEVTAVTAVQALGQYEKLCEHNIVAVIDPRASTAIWHGDTVHSHQIYKKRYSAKRKGVYSSRIGIDKSACMIAKYESKDMSEYLNSGQLKDYFISKACDGVMSFYHLLEHLGGGDERSVVIFSSGNNVFTACYEKNRLVQYNRAVIDHDVSDMRSIILHDTVPILQGFHVFEEGRNIHYVEFSDQKDQELIHILENDLGIEGIKKHQEASFEEMILQAAMRAVQDKKIDLHYYFENFNIPIIPWKYLSAMLMLISLLVVGTSGYQYYRQKEQLNYWEKQVALGDISSSKNLKNFTAVKSASSGVYRPNWDQFFTTLLYDTPNNIWLRSMVFQFDTSRFFIQGWARNTDKSKNTSRNVYEYVEYLTRKAGINTRDIFIENASDKMFIDIIDRKTANATQQVKIRANLKISLQNNTSKSRIDAVGFMASNYAEGEYLKLDPAGS